MSYFRKKPVVIEAIELTHALYSEERMGTIREFMSGATAIMRTPDGVEIPTPEGVMLARIGDFIIKGVNGEFYPCKPDIFALTYEPAPTQDKERA